MALNFIDSFGHYGTGTTLLRKWTSGGGMTIVGTGGRRNGAFVSGAGNLLKTLKHKTRYIMGVAAQFSSVSGQPIGVYNNGRFLCGIAINNDHTVSLAIGNLSTGVSSTVVPDLSDWHYYEIDATVGDVGGTVTATGSIRIDGQSYGNFSGTSNILSSSLLDGSATINQIGINVSGTANYMDLYVLDTTATDLQSQTSTNTTFLGDVEIDALMPAVDVAVSWSTHGGDGTHVYSCINEVPPDDDTSYVSSTNTGTLESFNHTPIAGFTGEILGAQYSVYAKKTAEGTRIINVVVGGTNQLTLDFFGTANYLSDYFTWYTAPMDSDNGVAWTTSVYNAEAFGVKIQS